MMDGVVKRDIINYRRQKAHDLMHDVDILMENEFGILQSTECITHVFILSQHY